MLNDIMVNDPNIPVISELHKNQWYDTVRYRYDMWLSNDDSLVTNIINISACSLPEVRSNVRS
jgi:hypothetical protein